MNSESVRYIGKIDGIVQFCDENVEWKYKIIDRYLSNNIDYIIELYSYGYSRSFMKYSSYSGLITIDILKDIPGFACNLSHPYGKKTDIGIYNKSVEYFMKQIHQPSEVDAPKLQPSDVDAPKLQPSDVDAPKLQPNDVDAPKLQPSEVDALGEINTQVKSECNDMVRILDTLHDYSCSYYDSVAAITGKSLSIISRTKRVEGTTS